MADNPREILIVRHGRTSHAFTRGRVTAAEFRAWIDDYNRAGLDAASEPSAELVELAKSVACVVCSDLRRALESAERLRPGVQLRVSPRFREAGRPMAGNWRVRLPLGVWDRISVFLWRLGCSTCDESRTAATTRARTAARELVELAMKSDRILFVGHGMINEMIGTELLKLGWSGPAKLDDVHWGCSTYRSS